MRDDGFLGLTIFVLVASVGLAILFAVLAVSPACAASVWCTTGHGPVVSQTYCTGTLPPVVAPRERIFELERDAPTPGIFDNRIYDGFFDTGEDDR